MYYTYINIQYINALTDLNPHIQHAVSSCLPFRQWFILDLLCVNKDAPSILSVPAVPLAALVGSDRFLWRCSALQKVTLLLCPRMTENEQAPWCPSPLTGLLTPASEFHPTALSQPGEFPPLPFPKPCYPGGIVTPVPEFVKQNKQTTKTQGGE